MSPFMGEVIGTMLLILLGDGVVANVLLAKTKGNNSGWIVITTAWALAVFVGAYSVASVSGAHLNPAVTIGLAVAGKFAWANVFPYIIAQFIGAFIGATLVWLHYFPHWAETKDTGLKLAVFSTGPAIRSMTWNLVSEIIGTFALVFGILAIKGAVMDSSGSAVPLNMGALGIIPVAFLEWVIGLALGTSALALCTSSCQLRARVTAIGATPGFQWLAPSSVLSLRASCTQDLAVSNPRRFSLAKA